MGVKSGKILVAVLICIQIIGAAGCKKSDDGVKITENAVDGTEEYIFFREDTAEKRHAEKFQMVSLSEGGIIHKGSDELIHLINIE